MTVNEAALSQKIEDALVARNLRGMKTVQPALEAGYCLRAAQKLRGLTGHVLIGTGFPVVDTFETDGPVGALALYRALEELGAIPVIVCGKPMSEALARDYRVYEIHVGPHDQREQEAAEALAKYQPQAIVSIERPGQAEDGGYYNMRGESISARAACFDSFVRQAECPTIAIGDGGNEIGMGNIYEALKELDIVASATQVDELLIADVSNWGAYGLMAFLSLWNDTDLLAKVKPLEILQYLSELGSVDGVTRLNELTEDGLPVNEGESILLELRRIIGFA
ncbi:DUF4392 domain-containing protein [Marinobacterium arenosum]|uniref:DUF4392 domain-containing protein n=1 Tax=Marinobacterium arenosum TaxID=2862496 RepID=UPI001C94E400|nr:DUF4392 domain-containing protein [Marinobacterium arenosum]MBY4677703.1 DUF4392 domain-containing protein [Marinobacterium arenosum]